MKYLVAGLGNPGPMYCGTRHNIGFDILEALCESLDLEFRIDTKLLCEISTFKNQKAIFYLIKPQTFMNLSGESIIKVSNFYKCDGLFVIHDDLDLPFGSIRFKNGGGNGGHNGLKSIDRLYGNDYYRLRFGIGRGMMDIAQYVLGKFEDRDCKDRLVQHSIKALETFFVDLDFLKLQNNFTIK
ncbi:MULTISPECIES: aminoacyl-tRNA hydrolase [unclassified Helicobacter]|uniref:aminoacyl-tRNA hydrolase n=1 Tax=unclassified Helicobacter TaxID=2593540 RepID=UPI000CF07C8C|nr:MULTISPECIES: aminoacyl-tRNA hydrolase [unclassified Helicobacter]